MSFHEKTTIAARGKWKGILMHFGIPAEVLSGKHGPCPLCQSKDNFRFDNKDQRGTWICTCGSGDGAKLAIDFTGKTFQEVAGEIDGMLGNVKPDAPNKPAMTDDERVKALRAVWIATKPVDYDDLASTYLRSRMVGDLYHMRSLRYGRHVNDGDGGVRPCMVAIVSDRDGKPVTLHRTFLRPDGLAKAEMDRPRKLMPGEVPEGSAVRLVDYHGGAIGIAEGVETALSAAVIYGVPVWACVSAPLMAKWLPPEGCDDVLIFGDNDPKFAGQAAAYTLAHRLSVRGITATVHIPPFVGQDFNDVLMKKTGSVGR